MLYHLTSEDCLKSILENGLKPIKGENQTLVDEERQNCVYLCDSESVKYWRVILDKKCLIQVSIDKSRIKEQFEYDNYSEYIVDGAIESVYVERATELKHFLTEPDNEIRKHIGLSYVNDLSSLCLTCCKLHCGRYDYLSAEEIAEAKKYLAFDLKATTAVVNRLDFNFVSKQDIEEELTYMGENGEYTLLDTYLDTEKRLYEILLEYESGDSKEVFKEAYETIKRIIGDININTGGFTG